MKTHTIDLPKTTGAWTRPDSPRIVTSQNIFDYMNGAGELYIGYRFEHLEVYEYTSGNHDNILVELYFMETSDDAFGLLSLDWGGELLSLSQSLEKKKAEAQASSIRALYGEGLLRIWSDNLYARVMAYHVTPESKEAVHFLGRAIASNRKNPPEPEILKIFSPEIGTGWKLRKDRMCFFRSYLVLNSIFYLSQQNILNLDHSAEAVTAPYERMNQSADNKRVRFLLIKYRNQKHAQETLNHFHDVYLPDHKKGLKAGSAAEGPSIFRIEDGWLGYQLNGKYLAIVFECPDQESARIIIQQNIFNLIKMED